MIIKCLIFCEKCTTATRSSTFTLQMKFWSDYGLGLSRVGVGKNRLVRVVLVHLSLKLLSHNLSFKLLSDSLWTVFLKMNAHNWFAWMSDLRDRLMTKYNISQEDYKMIEIVIIENKPHKAGPQWKFAGAFYFATVVLAMIGKPTSESIA